MDRQMEPTSQIFSQGGIRSRDWFSDKLQNKDRYVNEARQKARAWSQVTDCLAIHFSKVAATWHCPLT